MAFHPSQRAQSQLHDDDNEELDNLTGAQKAARTRKQNRQLMEREASEALQRPRGMLYSPTSTDMC